MRLKKRPHRFPLSKLFPNMVTIAGLCAGLSSLRFAMLGRWEYAVGFLVLAAIIDGLDGRIARMLGSTSTFGAQLDSLSDIVCFGVAPGIIMYLWSTHDVRGVGWAVAMLFTVCCALRLARFNTSLFAGPKAKWQEHFFSGVPAPAGAILAVLPMIISFEWSDDIHVSAWAHSGYVAIVAVLMASRLPTFSLKTVKVPHELIVPVMLLAAFWVASLIIAHWVTIAATSMLYLALIPISVTAYLREQKEAELLETSTNENQAKVS